MDKKWYVLIALAAVAVLLLVAFFGIAIYGACAPEEAFYDEQGNEETGLVHSIMTVFRDDDKEPSKGIPLPDEQEAPSVPTEQQGNEGNTTVTDAPNKTDGASDATAKPDGSTNAPSAAPATDAPATATPEPTPVYDGEGYSQEGWEEGDEIIVDFDDLFGTP